MPLKVLHVTSAHRRFDTRIFHKMCISSYEAGFEVLLIVADGLGDQIINGIEIIDVGRSNGKLDRVFRVVPLIYKQLKNRYDCIIHLHDPELLRIAGALLGENRKVIYDSHEDLPTQLLNKPYLNPIILSLISTVVKWYQNRVLKKVDAVVAATPYIRDKLSLINTNCVDINNYPVLTDRFSESKDYIDSSSVCYIGGLSYIRGIKEVVAGLQYCDKRISLIICGNFESSELESEIRGMPSWDRVDYRGYLDQQGVREVLSRSFAGLVTLHPTSNYLDSLPVKMFEYMSAGLPIIASNFEYWKPIVQSPECGLLVDPSDPKKIAQAIEEIFFNKARGLKMGSNGRDKIEIIYSWEIEKKKLASMYSTFAKQLLN